MIFFFKGEPGTNAFDAFGEGLKVGGSVTYAGGTGADTIFINGGPVSIARNLSIDGGLGGVGDYMLTPSRLTVGGGPVSLSMAEWLGNPSRSTQCPEGSRSARNSFRQHHGGAGDHRALARLCDRHGCAGQALLVDAGRQRRRRHFHYSHLPSSRWRRTSPSAMAPPTPRTSRSGQM